ncbi:hypothetical protein VTK73DRAFT_939 [Phialemonium thermophilum]|uniref:Uncharacterized protein n=1 Tax=Phialemonium thermophilum TaxID=223376 RepID=A0ABR3VU58_9PEZI
MGEGHGRCTSYKRLELQPRRNIGGRATKLMSAVARIRRTDDVGVLGNQGVHTATRRRNPGGGIAHTVADRLDGMVSFLDVAHGFGPQLVEDDAVAGHKGAILDEAGELVVTSRGGVEVGLVGGGGGGRLLDGVDEEDGGGRESEEARALTWMQPPRSGLEHADDAVDDVQGCVEAPLHPGVDARLVVARGRARAVQRPGPREVLEEKRAVDDDDGVPVHEVEDVALALEDGDQRRRVPAVQLQEGGHLVPPVPQQPRVSLGRIGLVGGGEGADGVEVAEDPAQDPMEPIVSSDPAYATGARLGEQPKALVGERGSADNTSLSSTPVGSSWSMSSSWKMRGLPSRRPRWVSRQ